MITIPDYSTIEAVVLAFYRNRFPGKDTHSESFLGKAARALARTILYLLSSLQSVDNDAVPSQKTSRVALNNMAFAYGLPSNAGGFGPNGPTAASGGLGPATGTKGSVIPDGTLLTGPDGQTVFKTSGSQTIPGTPPGSGSVNVNVVAVTAGSAGNLAAGQVLTFQAAPTGVDGTLTLTTGTSGGLDSEADAALLARIFARWQNPPKGGTAADYKSWAETVIGAFRAYVYPKRDGTGTVDIVITSAGSGAGRVPSAAVTSAVNDYINGNSVTGVVGQRPVTSSGVTAIRPSTTGGGLAIRVRVVPSASKYAFDWALGSSTLSVASYSSPTITTNEALPASLTQTVDAYLASPTTVSPPRLQVISTGMASPGIATPVSVVAYNAGAKTLTLQTPIPSAWTAPSANDKIYPYGPIVPIVAAGPSAAVVAGIQGYVDSLGPSRASGYANPLDVWADTASIFTVGDTALDAVDTDGVTRPVRRVLAVTINGGTTDVTATDDGTTTGVQILTCASIAVTD